MEDIIGMLIAGGCGIAFVIVVGLIDIAIKERKDKKAWKKDMGFDKKHRSKN
jgi:hypothetical protein